MSTTASIWPRSPVQGRSHVHAHPEPMDQAAVHIPQSTTNEWPDQAHEQDDQADHLCLCGSCPSGLGSEPTFCNPCIQHIRASIDPNQPFPHTIWSRSLISSKPSINPGESPPRECHKWCRYLQHHQPLLWRAMEYKLVVTQQRQKQEYEGPPRLTHFSSNRHNPTIFPLTLS